MKAKAIALIIAMSVAFAGAAGVVIFRNQKANKEVFQEGGYVLMADAEAKSQKILIEAGASYKRKRLTKEVEFKDVTGETREIAEDSFIHYDSGDVQSLVSGVLLNLNDVSGSFINHYSIPEKSVLSESGGGFSMKSEDAAVDFDECLWKVSDNSMIIFSPEIKVTFSDGDVRNAGSSLQVRFMDGNVVQCITSENVWHTISPDVFAQTAGGAKIYLARQMVEKNGSKLFLSKLTNSANVPTVLPKEETNNLAVPEISIEAVDGKNGEAGNDGEDGMSGSDGISGISGEDGEDGIDGKEGVEGEEGETGQSGRAGQTGTSGTNGSAGSSGGSGTNGNTGDMGNTGYTGNKGMAGIGVDGDSSTKTALPVMTFSSWDLSGTSLRGTVMVEDERGILKSSTGEISVYETSTEEERKAFAVDQGSLTENTSFDFSSLLPDGYEFGIDGLKPDTEYKIYVSSQYSMDDNSGETHIYKRDFIIRTFYTDSIGVYIEPDDITENSVSFQVIRQNYSLANTATLYILTEEQQKGGFNLENPAQYQAEVVSLESESGLGKGETVEFTQVKNTDGNPMTLNSNTDYYAYLQVGDTLTENTLTGPVKVKTRKQMAQVVDPTILLTMNKARGAIEVYRPKVTDVDQGIVKYIYEAVDTKTNEVVRTLEVSPDGSDTVMFYVDGQHIKVGGIYKVRVSYVFNDNEVETEHEVGESGELETSGDTIPVIIFEPTSDTTAADVTGVLRIQKGTSRIDDPSNAHPFHVNIIADGIYDKTIEINNVGEGEHGATVTESDILINLHQGTLKQNTTYRIGVSGYINGVPTHLGYASFSTRNLTVLKAVWKDPEDKTEAVIHKTLTLQAVDKDGNAYTGGTKDAENAEWDIKTLDSIKLTLYRGAGYDKSLLAEKEVVSDSNDAYNSSLVEKYFDEENPVDITEGFFGLTSSQLGNDDGEMNYTLEVTAAYDYTGRTSDPMAVTAYSNRFTISNASVGVIRKLSPPALPGKAELALKAVEILNKDAADYGKTVNTRIPDDAVIGYRLEPTYNNGSLLAREITYYAYEAYAYKNVEVQKKNPLLEDIKRDEASGNGTDDNHDYCFKKTISVEPTWDYVPSICIMFGEGSDSYYDGVAYYFAGEPHLNQQRMLTDGMGRGYQYVFAYTVGYTPTGTGTATDLYPYDAPDYQVYTNQTEYGVYNLNSGIKKAPRSKPIVYSYVDSSDSNALNVKYYYKDGDETISYEGPNGADNTVIQIKNQSSSLGSIGAKETWNEIRIPYREDADNSRQLSPYIDCKIYELAEKYNDMKDIFGTEPLFYMGSYPYDSTPETVYKNYMGGVDVDIDTSGINQNMLAFTVTQGQLQSDVFEIVKKKLSVIKVMFSQTYEEGGEAITRKLEKYLPVDPITMKASMFTSELGAFADKENEISVNFELIYDCGVQGWSLLSEEKGEQEIALQKYKKKEIIEDGIRRTIYELGDYVVKNIDDDYFGTREYAVNSYFIYNPNFSNGNNKLPEFQLDYFQLFYGIRTSLKNQNSINRYYSYSRNGISEGIYNAETNPIPASYEVPKKLSTLKYGGTGKFTLNSVTPSIVITRADLAVGVNSTEIVRFTLKGFDPTIKVQQTGRIQFRVYKKGVGGSQLGEEIWESEEIDVKKGEMTSTKRYTVTGVEASTDYVMIAYYKDAENKWVPLLDGSQLNVSKTNSLSFSTKSEIKVGFSDKPYTIINNSYFDKKMQFTYTLDQTFNIRIEYELMDQSGNVIANAEKLDEAGVIDRYSPGQSYTNTMSAVMKLGIGSLLKQGKTYKIGVKVLDKDTGNQLNSSSSFTVTIPSNTSPSIYFSSVPETSDNMQQITFECSVVDKQNVLMGRMYNGGHTAGLYKVRFYKIDEKTLTETPISTEYDDKLFDAQGMKKFVLTDLDQTTRYKMAVYGVLDLDEDGKNDNGQPPGKYEWSHYYQGATEEGGTSGDEDIAGKSEYLIGSRIQITLDDRGIYYSSVSFAPDPRRTRYLRMILTDAIGLEKITSMEYSIVGSNGHTENGTKTNSSGGSLFVSGDGYSYYDFSKQLPDGFAKYNIVVRFYIGDELYETIDMVYVKTQ